MSKISPVHQSCWPLCESYILYSLSDSDSDSGCWDRRIGPATDIIREIWIGLVFCEFQWAVSRACSLLWVWKHYSLPWASHIACTCGSQTGEEIRTISSTLRWLAHHSVGLEWGLRTYTNNFPRDVVAAGLVTALGSNWPKPSPLPRKSEVLNNERHYSSNSEWN